MWTIAIVECGELTIAVGELAVCGSTKKNSGSCPALTLIKKKKKSTKMHICVRPQAMLTPPADRRYVVQLVFVTRLFFVSIKHACKHITRLGSLVHRDGLALL